MPSHHLVALTRMAKAVAVRGKPVAEQTALLRSVASSGFLGFPDRVTLGCAKMCQQILGLGDICHQAIAKSKSAVFSAIFPPKLLALFQC